MKFWKPSKTFVLFLALFAFAMAWGFYLEPSSIRVKEHSLHLPGWPKSLSGLRVAVLADLHIGSPYQGLDKLERIVRMTNAAKPDIILIPGDMVVQGVKGGTFIAPETFAPRLAGLRARHGVWCVLGNHDWWLDASRMRKTLEAAGIPVLDERVQFIRHGKDGFWLAGVSDAMEGTHDVAGTLAKITDDKPVLLFTHSPDIFPQVPERVALTIAGHTHGGQVYIPFVGRPIVPSDYGQRYAAGHIEENRKHAFVSTGIGTSILPVRFLVPPEISVLNLHAKASE